MDIIQGRNLNLYIKINGFNQPVGHAKDCKLVITADTHETTTKNTLRGKTYDYANKYGYTLQLEAITNFIDYANLGTFQNAILQSNKLSYIFSDLNDVEWSGTVLVTQADLDSIVNSFSTYTANFLGDGEIVPVYTCVNPPPIGASVNIIDQLSEILATVPAPGTYQVLKFDTIDCGDAYQSNVQLIIMPAQ